MSDMMMFPETVEEFMEQYKIVDSDEVYTNGVELVPIFRMKQWFEHVDAVPIRHGFWIDMGDFEQCSVCYGTHLKEVQTYYGKMLWLKTSYCPNCGAKMDEVVE